jgi:hypothetical protein
MAMAILPIILVLVQLYSVEVDAWGIVIQGFKPKDLSCPGVGYEWLNPFSTNPNFIKAFYKVGSWDECAKYCEENAKCETWIYWWDKKARWAFQCRIYTLDHPKTIEIVTHLYNNTIMGLKGCRQQQNIIRTRMQPLKVELSLEHTCIKTNTDCKGYDIRFEKTPDQNKCIDLCKKQQECKAIVYQDATSRCFLKSSESDPRRMHGMVCAYMSCFKDLEIKKVDSCAELITCQENKSQYGHDLDHFNTNDRNACAKKCCENTECIGFDWDTKSMDCWLSKMTWNDVPLNDHNYRWACQKKDVNKNGKYD